MKILVKRQFLARAVPMTAMILAAGSAAAQADGDGDWRVEWEGAPEISSPDGSFTFKPRGRLFVDAGFVDQDTALTGIPDIDATEIRAARLGMEGIVWSDVKYKLEVDFAGNDTELKDGYVQYRGWPVALTVGQRKTPNSLEELGSSRFITFMERASVTDAFGLARQVGVTASYGSDLWTVEAGVFRGSAGTDDRDEGLTLAGRATVAPRFGDDGVVHLGAHVRRREAGDDQGLFRYRQRPHQHTADRFVDTGGIADEDMLLGLEFAAVKGPFSVQGEYMRLKAETPDGEDDNPTFNGWYAEANWFFTGESRNYGGGDFGRVTVRNPVFDGGMGAWQLAVRYDTIDLTDEAVFGGKQDTYLAGINWHLNNHVRFMANYNISDIKGGPFDGADINAFGLRAQVDW